MTKAEWIRQALPALEALVLDHLKNADTAPPSVSASPVPRGGGGTTSKDAA